MFIKNPESEESLLKNLHQYAENHLWVNLSEEEKLLLQLLDNLKIKFNFPAVKNDVGQILNFLVKSFNAKTIFEFGSGYGHSAFWYFIQNINIPKKVYLTERRTDLENFFHELPWNENVKKSLDYFCGDAFLRIQTVEAIDLCLLDGQKSQYLEFLKVLLPKLSSGGIIIIDNAFIKGQFLDADLQNKEVVKKTHELHLFLENSYLERLFLPVRDGLLILRKPN